MLKIQNQIARTVAAGISLVLLTVLPTRLTAQPVSDSGVRLITLGTRAGQFPAPYRAQASNALIVGDSIYLFDAGDGALRRMAEAKLTIRNVANVFITHLHDDHTSGLPALMNVIWEFHRQQPVGIYGPPQTADLVKSALAFSRFNAATRQSDGTITRSIDSLYEGHDVQPGQVFFRDDNITVSAIENSHYGTSAGNNPTQSLSYRVTTPAGVIIFTGDTGPSEAVTQFAKDADLLVSEITDVEKIIELRKADGSWETWTPAQQQSLVGHITNEHLEADAVADIATGGNVGAVLLTHLPPTLDLKADYQWLAEDVKKNGYTGPTFVAQDLSEFTLVPRAGQRPEIIRRDTLREQWLGQ